MSFSEAQGSVLAKNRQNPCEVYKVIVNSSIATMSAMGGSGDHCSLMVRSTLRGWAIMCIITDPDGGVQNRAKSLTSASFLMLVFVCVVNFHLEEVKSGGLAQVWCPDLSKQERNQGGKMVRSTLRGQAFT